MRRRRIFIVVSAHYLTGLDLWPGDEVWDHDYRELGHIGRDGQYVPKES